MQHSNIPKQVQNETEVLNLKQNLHEVVASLHFSDEMKQAVLDRAKPSIWEREITIPIPALAIAIVLMMGIGILNYPESESIIPAEQQTEQNRVIDMGTGIFWESDIKGGQR